LDVPLKIVSDGFDIIIRNVLERYFSQTPEILKHLPIYSNRLDWTADGPRAVFSTEDICRHGCANCKPEAIKSTAWVSDHIFFVGDGLSDRYAALLCNRVFAKQELLKFCLENDLAHDPYTNFEDVEKWLLKNYEALKTLCSIQLRTV
jgi:2-hydroxy-3-keto-5-methylthiopentenyl-1-phosphate phosphatase